MGQGVAACSSQFVCRECKWNITLCYTKENRLQLRLSSRGIPSRFQRLAVDDHPESHISNSLCIAKEAFTGVGACVKMTELSNVPILAAVTKLWDKTGAEMQLRALLDSGSQASFIVESNATALMLETDKETHKIVLMEPTRINKKLGTNLFKRPDRNQS